MNEIRGRSEGRKAEIGMGLGEARKEWKERSGCEMNEGRGKGGKEGR